MIWMVITKAEMEDRTQHHVFCHNEEALGRENIRLVSVDEDDPLTFVEPGDIIFSRTFNKRLLGTISKLGVANTAEDYLTYRLVKDKLVVSSILGMEGITVPKIYSIDEVYEGKTYFVKPRFGEDSLGITTSCICNTKEQIITQKERIQCELHQDSLIEEFVEGVDCTVACYVDKGMVVTRAIGIEIKEKGGIQTHKGKFNFAEYCYKLPSDESEKVKSISSQVFSLLKIKHHARIDFRKNDNGEFFLIDINLLPGLGPLAHFQKCLLLDGNKSYVDSLMFMVNSATL